MANGDYSTSVANARYSTSVANEHSSTSVANAHSSTSVANEHSSTSVANGKNSIALIRGCKSKVRWRKWAWLVATEYDNNFENIINVQVRQVDWIKIKEDTLYILDKWKFIEYDWRWDRKRF